MKKTIHFQWDGSPLKLDADKIIIPRIGEKIDIVNFFTSDTERIEWDKFKGNGFVYVVDINHSFDESEQIIEIWVSPDLTNMSEFYETLQKPELD